MIRSARHLLLAILCAALVAGGLLVPLAIDAPTASAAVAVATFHLSSTDSTSVFGQSVSIIATITGSGAVPTGSLDFIDDGTAICAAAPLSNPVANLAVASCPISNLAVGNHQITASYSGDGSYAPASSTDFGPALSQAVARAGTTTVVDASSVAVFSAPSTITATVAPTSPGAGALTGTVEFQAGGSDIPGCETAPLTSGAAVCSSPATAGTGTRQLTAIYSGDDNFVTSSGSFTQTFARAGAAIAVTSSAAHPNLGAAIVYTADLTPVSPATATPNEGSVVFQADNATIDGCEAATVSAGEAMCSTVAGPRGTISITAAHGSTSDFNASSSPAFMQDVGNLASTTTVSSSDLTSTFEQSVTFTATVAPVAVGGATPPGGTASFSDGGTALTGCETQPVSGGIATCSTTDLTVGDHTVTAGYSGDGGYTPSSSSVITETVSRALTSSVVAQSAATSAFGQSVTFTATVSPVSPATGTPTGSVGFGVDGSIITGCTAKALNGSGVATCTTGAVPTEAASITAVYSADASYATSTAPAIVHTVAQAGTSTTLTSDSNPSVFSTAVTFTAVVVTTAPGVGPATGSVAFKRAGVDIAGCGTKTLDGSAIATCTTSTIPVGSHAVTAVYATTTNFGASTSAPLTQTVPQPASTTMVSTSDSTTAWNDSVTYTATIAPVSPATAAPTGGAVMFLANGVGIPTCTLRPVVNAVASCPTTNSPVGTLSITAEFSGDQSYAPSTAPAITQTVTKAVTATALIADHNPSRSGQAVTLTATVTSTAGVPGGTVSFFQVQKDSSRRLVGVGTLDAGNASMTTDVMTVRIGNVVADYDGSSTFQISTVTVSQTVSRSYSTTLITSSQKRARAGRAVTFRVVVASDGEGTGTPTGLVALYRMRANGSREWIGRGTLRRTGITTITVPDLPIGSWKIVAEYRGSTEHRDSHRSMTQSIGT